MIKVGEYQSLTIEREMPQGLYLSDGKGNEVLLPRNFVTPEMRLNEQVEVFVYCDSNDMDVATTERPFLTVGEFAGLMVKDVNRIGAFCDWGITKQLLIPYRNQADPMVVGRNYIIYMYLDEVTDRLVGTTKIHRYLKHEQDGSLEVGQEVDLLVWRKMRLGYGVIINQTYAGLIYDNELPHRLQIGEKLKGYVKPFRADAKIDVSINPIGVQSIARQANVILEKLEEANGFLPLTDKSSPEAIRQTFGLSKKLFKKSLGMLYKQRIVRLEADGIYLNK